MNMLRAPQPPSTDADDGRCAHADVITRALNSNIIPRLIQAHPGLHTAQRFLPAGLEPLPADIADPTAFARLLLDPDPAPADRYVASLRRRGLPVDSLYLDVIAPAARMLGEWWEADECSFTDVTLATGRLQQMLREHGLARDTRPSPASEGRRVLLVPAPGEQHSLGLLMVAEFFRQAGWDVHGGPTEASADPVRAVARFAFDAIGFSLAASLHIDELRRTLVAVRQASRNPRICIMVGGAAFAETPSLHEGLDADLALSDAAAAPVAAVNFLQQKDM
jgi:methanogenic corrinoid protein MtbC1